MAGNLLCSPSTLCLDTLFTSSDKKISEFTRPHAIGFVADIFFFHFGPVHTSSDSLRIYFFPLWPCPHVIGFVADIFFSTLESGFIFFRIRCRILRIRVAVAVSGEKKLRIRKYPDTCGRGLRYSRILMLK